MKLRSSLWALATCFLVDGAGFGIWASHLPSFRTALKMSNGGLSLVLLCVVLGSIVSMPLAGKTIARIGSRKVLRRILPIYVLSLAALGLAPNAYVLAAIALLFGAAKGAVDVTINAQAADLETELGRSHMSFLQGFWSVGGLVGAAGSSLAFRIGGTTRLHLLVAASILGLLTFVSRDALVQPRNLHEEEKLRFPDASLLGLAILAFFALFCEGAIGDWSAVYLHFHLKLSSAVSAAGFAAYAVFMAISRFTGDWAGRNLSRSTVLSASGAAVSIGFLLTLSAPNAWFALGGLALTGLGTANVIPIVLQLASKSSSMSAGPAISAVSTLGYFGFLAGPPLIGWLATGIGLPLALGLVVASGVVIALGPLFLRGVLVSAAPENEYIEAATK